ncbi:hypothetical protein VP1G_10684 [Cytospora mali]|uniref:Uncharacterized protein n=1 Tax=Cytospora mali TaxID=578113 RepID=A0A194URX3_CYTMA|nr:hypothetical protein VP1G_10684 [Valsa mali var. pyri (nom. inval.)]
MSGYSSFFGVSSGNRKVDELNCISREQHALKRAIKESEEERKKVNAFLDQNLLDLRQRLYENELLQKKCWEEYY